MATEKRFTEDLVKGITAPTEGRTEYRDTSTAGLYLRVTSGGSKSFSFVGRTKGSGKTERVTIGKWPAIKVKEAQVRALQLAAGMASGSSAALAGRARRSELTVGELFAEYLANSKARRPDIMQNVFRLYVEPSFGRRRLSELDHIKVATWHRGIPRMIAKRKTEAAAAAGREAHITSGHSSANQALALLRAMYAWAIKKARLYAGDNPASGIDDFAVEARDRFLTKGELQPFFAALLAYPDPTMRSFFFTALMTGARRSNVLAMRWGDLDLEAATWRIAMTKNGTPQTVTLVAELVDMLRDLKPSTDDKAAPPWVFASPTSKSGHIMEPKGAWQSILKAAGLTDLRLHDLRRTLGSWQAGTGASLSVIGKSLNHKDHTSTAIYARLDLDPVRQSVERATSAMLEAAGVKNGAQVLPIRKTG